jgi:CubicO group peptidase (beta-lactamase class C family)
LAWLKSQDPIHYVLAKKMNHVPGTSYLYNSGATHLLSGIVTKASGLSTLDFAKQKLFGPLKVDQVHWEMRRDGCYDGGGFGLEMRPTDLLKIGQLLLDKGLHNGQQLIGAHWIDKLFNEGEKWSTNWGLPGSTHGFCWYHALVDNIQIHYAMGYGGQFIFLIPEKDLVVVATHNHDTTKGARQQTKFLREKFTKLIQVY